VFQRLVKKKRLSVGGNCDSGVSNGRNVGLGLQSARKSGARDKHVFCHQKDNLMLPWKCSMG